MRQSIALLSVLAGATYAANTIDFVFPGDSEGVDPVATILSANPSTTAMHIACPSGVDSNDCGWGIGFDYTIISGSHYQAQIVADSATLSFGCDHNTAKADMTCVVDDGEGQGPATSVLSGSEISFNHATVIQGAELLSAGGSASASASASAAPKTSGAAVATNTGMQSASMTGSAASKASSSPTGSTAAAQHTGAAAKYGVHGSALLILAGAAAANVL